MANIRVLIADDSSLARGLLRCALEAEPIKVVGEACNGRQEGGRDGGATLRPSLVTMVAKMPVMGGLQAIRKTIMCTRAVPILVVSSVADAQGALQAVAHGALDVVGKPDYGSGDAAAFVAKVACSRACPSSRACGARSSRLPPRRRRRRPRCQLAHRPCGASRCSPLPLLPAGRRQRAGAGERLSCGAGGAALFPDGFAQGMVDWPSRAVPAAAWRTG